MENYKSFFANFKKLTIEEWQEKVDEKQNLLNSAQNELNQLKMLLKKKDINL
jgi:DNA-binding transcriptional regulator GbsR (MarR family)